MYPDWPKSTADLVPLPYCDGPKLKPFPFQGPQRIKFLDYLGEGSHAHVFKTEINGNIYALKLFRFCREDIWGPPINAKRDDRKAMATFYNYTEPFNSECRAFGRLQEAGYEELAIKCFGYLLLDEEYERAMMNQFGSRSISFWDIDNTGDSDEDMRSIFSGKNGRAPPIRGIVKEFGPTIKDMQEKDVKRIHQNIISLHQLGITGLDIADRQLINGKLSDLSTAITTPHFVTTPDLNPDLTPESTCAMELELFRIAKEDYHDIDAMVRLWNDEHRKGERPIQFRSFSDANYSPSNCNKRLRDLSSRRRVYTYVDPRRYDWRASSIGLGQGLQSEQKSGRKATESGHGKPRVGVSKTIQLKTKPSWWYYDCNDKTAARLKNPGYSYSLVWELKAGVIFPQKRKR
ncbi:kinetochore Sim4 complex subunit FTA2-domain-containing protein [Xylaria curta]|nr:kinetochore Sim4 complex subunit FTA2-domain-containing protein [Xylaria curta]